MASKPASKYPTVKAFKSMHKTGEWAEYFKQGEPGALEKDFIKVEKELAEWKRSVRTQIEKAKLFIKTFASDLEMRQTAADARSEVLSLWEALKVAYEAENTAAEKVQDCCDKYPKTSALVRQTKESMKKEVNFPALFERLCIVSKLDSERKELQKTANEAKAARLALEEELTKIGATLDPSYAPAPRMAPQSY